MQITSDNVEKIFILTTSWKIPNYHLVMPKLSTIFQ
jgi:hypothetical protein